MSTPADDGFFMPAEWHPHSRCWMAWPVRESVWGEGLDAACEAYVEVAQAIARFEPVTMLAPSDYVADVSVRVGPGVGCLPMAHSDSWTRDTAPTFVIDGKGGLAGVDWGFNAWGGLYPDHGDDAALAAGLLDHLDVARYQAPLIAEGGALHSDGEGTLLAVEATLVNDNRNPGKSRAEVEALLKAYTGAKTVIWLPEGLKDDETDGHVDNVACFAAPGKVLALAPGDAEEENHARLKTNLEVLRAATDAQGRSLEVVELPLPKPKHKADGTRLTLSYINFYLPNGGLVLPAFEDSADEKAYSILEDVFPDRELVQIPALPILQGGGGIHCITQQQPKPRPEPETD
jgi:agmatine deiminase